MPGPNWRPDPSIVADCKQFCDIAKDNESADTQGMPVDNFDTLIYRNRRCKIVEATPQEKFNLGKKLSDVIWILSFPEPLTVEIGDRVRFWDFDEQRDRFSRVQKPAENRQRQDLVWFIYTQEVNQ